MKNMVKLFGIIIVAAIIGVSFVACGNGSTENGGLNENGDLNIVGKWYNDKDVKNDSTTACEFFSDNKFDLWDSGSIYASGTYTLVGSTLSVDLGGGEVGTCTLELTGTTLTFKPGTGVLSGGMTVYK